MTAERIDHAAEAQKHIEWAHEQQERDGEYEHSVRDNAILAQAEATLALVEQQRIANLLVLSEKVVKRGHADSGFVLDGLRTGVAGEVWEGLGL